VGERLSFASRWVLGTLGQVSEGNDPRREPGTGAAASIARQLRRAIETSDVSAFGDLLDPDVTWGAPGAPVSVCTNREQVLAWYSRGRDRGGRATVSEITGIGDKLLVGLVVHGTEAAKERGGAALRWQVLTVREGRIVDIAGFDSKPDALARATASE
jgi:ketosteroid isomerase-like protein